jgi:hypothetical protein
LRGRLTVRGVRGLVATALALASAAGLGTSGEAYEVITVVDGGGIRGKVTFQGAAPPPRKLQVNKDTHVCAEGPSERQEVHVNGGKLRDVVVVVQEVKRGKAWPALRATTLEQRKCEFFPFMQVVPPRGELTIVNHDPVLHNLHSYEITGTEIAGGARRTLFNLAQPRQGDRVVKTIAPRRGDVVRLECDAHDWMLAWLYVPSSPYYAVVTDDGSFRIDEIPPGTYKVKAWHPVLGMQEQDVKVTAKGQSALAFVFSAR